MANGGIIGPVQTPEEAVSTTRTVKTSSGPLTFQPTTEEIEVLIVAGGGGGGYFSAGGGGGGGVKYYGTATGLTDCGPVSGSNASEKTANGAAIPVSGGGSACIVVGGGGAARGSPGVGNPGSGSSITIGCTPYSATGGGGGGYNPGAGSPGGSGGGGGGQSGPGAGIAGEGNPGGTAVPGVGDPYTAGGGGATQPGFNYNGSPTQPGPIYGGMGGAGAGYNIADGCTVVYYGGGSQGDSVGTSPAKTTFGRNSSTANTGGGGQGAGKDGTVIVVEPGRPASAPGVWSIDEVYNYVKEGQWTS